MFSSVAIYSSIMCANRLELKTTINISAVFDAVIGIAAVVIGYCMMTCAIAGGQLCGLEVIILGSIQLTVIPIARLVNHLFLKFAKDGYGN